MEILQEVFERELVNFKYYSFRVKEIRERYECLRKKQEKILEEEQQEKSICQVLNIVKDLKLSETCVQELKANLDNHISKDNELNQTKNENSNKMDLLTILLGTFTECRTTSKNLLFACIIEANELGEQFVFNKDNRYARKIFCMFYSVQSNYYNYRNVIKVDGCKLSKTFMKYYSARTEKMQERALRYFEIQSNI